MAKLHKAVVKSPEDVRDWIRAELHDRYEAGWQAGYSTAVRDGRYVVRTAEEKGYLKGNSAGYERGATDALSAVLARLGEAKPIDATQILRDLLKGEALFNG